jgi:hypothetical protein
VCTAADPAAGWKAVTGALDIQLILNSADYANLRPFLERRVELQGTLLPAHGEGHHHAPLLLDTVGRRPGD